MKTTKKHSILIFMVLLFTYNINAQTWEEIGFNLPEGDTASSRTQITFVNKDTGWVFTYTDNMYKLFKTTNRGENWQKIKTLNGNFPYFTTAIFSREPDFFYMMNSDYTSTIGNFARFTADGGITWDSTEISNERFRIINFYSEQKGIALSDRRSWITTDGGRIWEQKDTIVLPTDIYFQNENLGWAVGYGPIANDVGYVAKTLDGGETWDYLDVMIGAFSSDQFGIDFLDSLRGFAVGETVAKTIDGGSNWQTITGVGGYDVGFLDDRNGWISSAGNIFYTSDGGEIWTSQLDNVMHYFFIKIIVLRKDKAAYVLGVNPDSNTATLLRADLSSLTGVEENNETIPNKFHLYQNYPNPFNPTTSIEYQVPRHEMVTLKIYDLLGNEIAVLVNETKLPGTYKVNFNGNQLASGVYIARLTTEGSNKSIKLILLK